MRDLKRFLAVFVAVAVMLTAMVPAFAASVTVENLPAANTLNALGLYAGIDLQTFDPDLESAVDRETSVSLLVKMFGKESAATAMSAGDVDTVLARFSDASAISDWAKPYVAYAVQNGLVKGNTDGTFGPQSALLGKAYCTMILRNMGYDNAANYDAAAFDLAAKKGLSFDQAVKFNTKALIKDDLVAISLAALQTVDASGVTLIKKLIDAGVVKVEDAVAQKVYVVPVDQAAIDAAAAAKAAAEVAVKAYELADTSDLTAIANAEKLEVAAVAAVEKVKDATDNKAFSDRIAAKKADVTDLKNVYTPATATVDVSNLGGMTITFSKAINPVTVPYTDADGNVNSPSPATVQVFADGSSTNLIADGTRGILSDDKKVLTLKYIAADYLIPSANPAYPVNQYSKLKVVFSGVKDVDGNKVVLNQTFTTMDIQEPSVASVAVGTSNLYKKLVITANEPLSVATGSYRTLDATGVNTIGVKVDGKNVYAKATSYNLSKLVIIDLPANLTEGKHTVDVYGAKDYAGFMMKPFSGEVTVVYDVTAPKAVSASIPSKKTVSIDFDEKVTTVNATAKFSVKETGSTTEKFSSVKTNTTNGVTTLVLNTSTLALSSLTAPVTITVEGLKDMAGNVMTEKQTFTAMITDDVTAPTFSSVKMLTAKEISDEKANSRNNSDWYSGGVFDGANGDSGTRQWLPTEKAIIRVTLSEACNMYDLASPVADMKLYKKGSTTLLASQSGGSIVAKWAGYDNQYDLYIPILNNLAMTGDYTLVLTNVKDYSLRSNTAEPITIDFTTLDINAPTIVEAYRIGNDRISIRFSEDMDTATTSVLSNYLLSINSSAYAYASSITNAIVESTTSNTAVLYIPGCNVGTTMVTGFAILGAKDLGGNLLSSTGSAIGSYYTNIVGSPSSIGATDVKVEATAKNTIKVTLLNSHTFKTVDPSSFVFKKAGLVEDVYKLDLGVVSAVVSADGTYATITLSGDNLTATAKEGVNSIGTGIDMYIVGATGTTDEVGRDIVIGTGKTIVDKIPASQVTDTKVASDANGDTNAAVTTTFSIAFDEMLDFSPTVYAIAPVLPGNPDPNLAVRKAMLATAVQIKLADGTILTPGTDYTVSLSTGTNPTYAMPITILKTGLVNETITVNIINTSFIVDKSGNNNPIVVKTVTVTNVKNP